jgi:head-tail adaptor
MSRETVRLWVRSQSDEKAQKALELLKDKCDVVLVESPGVKSPTLATAYGVFEGLEKIEYFATAWI